MSDSDYDGRRLLRLTVQAQTRSAARLQSTRVELDGALEQLRLVLSSDADARVDDLHYHVALHHAFAVRHRLQVALWPHDLRIHPHVSVLRRELDGVVDQIANHLTELLFIDVEGHITEILSYEEDLEI